MELEARLRAFAALARHGSFSTAASELGIGQPAVSRHVADLEVRLGRRLVVRGRRIRLTPAGQVLAEYVLRAEALLANASRAVAADAAETGVLAVAASGTPGTYLLPRLLARFTEQHPGVDLHLEVGTSIAALERVRGHAVELAVVGGLTIPTDLIAEGLVEDQIVLIGPPAIGGRRVSRRALAAMTWVTREEGSATRAAVEAARWQMGIQAVRTLELPSWEAVKLAVADGAGVAAISRFALDVELRAGAVAVLDVPRWRLTRTISTVRARDVPLTPPAQRFLAVLTSAWPRGVDE